jgi:hypothetical protein
MSGSNYFSLPRAKKENEKVVEKQKTQTTFLLGLRPQEWPHVCQRSQECQQEPVYVKNVYPYLYSAQRKLFWKGQCHEIFCFSFFSWIIFIQAPENNIRIIVNFSQAVSTTRWKICHRYCWCRRYRWQIIGTLSECYCLHLKVNLKTNYSWKNLKSKIS